MSYIKNFSRMIAVLFAAVLLVGCASSMVLGTVYDGFGSKTAKRFKSYATFNSGQQQVIDSFANSFHSWHRTTQLDRYAAFLRSMVADIESSQTVSFGTADKWFQSVRSYSHDMRACNPFNNSADLLAGLTDKQVNQIAANLNKELKEREDENKFETAQQRIDQRVKDISKWASRAGAKFNDEQKQLLRVTLTNQVTMGAQRLELRRGWIEQFKMHLDRRDQSDFKQRIAIHIDGLWNLTERNFPNEWKANEKLWTSFFKDFINLQSVDQRNKFTGRVLATAAILEKLGNKKVKTAPVCHRSQ